MQSYPDIQGINSFGCVSQILVNSGYNENF